MTEFATPHEDNDLMYCRTCAAEQLLTDARIESTHRSAEGLVGYLRCSAGHLVVHQFAEAYPKPQPPASVLALRAHRPDIEQEPAEQKPLDSAPIEPVIGVPLASVGTSDRATTLDAESGGHA